ncbi:lysophospholipid acyltransferase family protein [Brachybacterium saurashtrense]|uniref:1-acyl-sn-glycerol-3-phosphate acyltransferase n=1 Tax=Brachybacterium saurashtrense TaxID=556288 RepID=A0A345YQC7_9MICO|nr:lysophospholipid acyltransferase family protein [Brachybacterium saurashtrense]AXK46129.1 1-acyl-sn-glycerol-3-phosphate acyltransferase [Brachybacterium saurashtrense]RRR23869.1 1-acyl-sn-glycerol-3-phosphate acyltransferase [Brachybacterium saurashtrense]
MTSQDPQEPPAAQPPERRLDAQEPEAQESSRRAEAAARLSEASTRAADATAKAADDLRGRSRKLFDSLSARSRGEGWEKPTGELAKYRSGGRAALRFVLQRIVFRAVVNSAVTPQVQVHRRVRSVRGPFVLVANHTSHVDAPLLAMSLPWTQARFLSTGVAADYWFDHWHRRIFVRLMMNAFPIDRGGSRKHSGTSRRLLRSGVPILVFPEGGRQQTGSMAGFKPGAAALAIGVGVPVVPAAIIGGYEAMPKGRSWPVPGRPPVRVVFGDPMIAHEDESAVDFSTRIQDRVAILYDEHYHEVLGDAAGGEEETA